LDLPAAGLVRDLWIQALDVQKSVEQTKLLYNSC
jgi:hypothetical protein